MKALTENQHNDYRVKKLSIVLLCLVCVLVNSSGAQLAQTLGIPLFLDSIGTMLAAVIGGYLPGIIVGYLTNLITSFDDPINAYYSSLNALIAVLATWFYHKGWFRRLPTTLLSILAFSFVGGVLGSLITLLLNGFSFGTGISSPFAMWLSQTRGWNPALAQFISDILIDLGDKTAVVAVFSVVIRIIPRSLRESLNFEGWQQAPLSRERRAALSRRENRVMSLRSKLLIMLVSALLLTAVASTTISVIQYHNSSISKHTKMGEGVAALVANAIPAQRVDDFIALGENAPGYEEVKERLALIRDSSPDIDYVYVYQIQPDGCHVVFDLDTEEVEGSKPGEVIPFDADFAVYLPELLTGGRIAPVISDGAYGWLLTVYEPVYDANGVCKCYAAADISMNTIRSEEIVFVTKVMSIFLGFFILILAIGLWLADYNVTLPINSLAAASGSFAYNSENAREESLQAIRELDIQTGDEIEHLYHAMVKTTADMVDYIADVQEKSATIARMQDGLILVLADLVESRDKCTGDHVRKTAAYVNVIVQELRREGVYADQITDEFIHDVVHSAPLHDIGKINVPDSILNKPGKLTDEEFAIMKGHTTAGGEVIDSAIETIGSDEGYLREARNLAACHHEKWNGTGYPNGLAGEDIPLGARIMAVADVFDALVSRRSYKEPFTIEKAMDIIREGAGSHFDPKVVAAFLNAEDEVRRIASANMEKEKLPDTGV